MSVEGGTYGSLPSKVTDEKKIVTGTSLSEKTALVMLDSCVFDVAVQSIRTDENDTV